MNAPGPAARPPEVVYEIGPDDRILRVNPAWSEFAAENGGGPEMARPTILGCRLWDFIGDPSTCELYQGIVARVRTSRVPFRFRFRCDSPACRRLLRMTVARHQRCVRFQAETVAIQKRPAVPLLDPALARSGDMLITCSWCKRIPVPRSGWLEVEHAVQALALFEEPALPILSHGICPDCLHRLVGVLDSPLDRDPGELVLGALPAS